MDGSPSLNLETAAWMVADEGVLGVREGEEDGWRGRLLRGVDGPAESGEIERLAKCTRRVALLPMHSSRSSSSKIVAGEKGNNEPGMQVEACSRAGLNIGRDEAVSRGLD